MTKTRHASVFN